MEATLIFLFIAWTVIMFVGGVFVGKKHAAKIQNELDEAEEELIEWRAKASALLEAAEKAAKSIKSKF